MNRLLQGNFHKHDGEAASDFEALTVGTITDITLGVTIVGNCSWRPTVFHQR